MGGPGFATDATIALPTARIAVMGPEAAVNAVYANKIAQVEADEGEAARDEFIAARRAEYLEDVDLERLAADLVIDQVIEPEALREELLARGRQLEFHPDFMRVRYENWTNGLTGDWLISRQRFFGVQIGRAHV